MGALSDDVGTAKIMVDDFVEFAVPALRQGR